MNTSWTWNLTAATHQVPIPPPAPPTPTETLAPPDKPSRPLEPIHSAGRAAGVEAHSRFLYITEQGAVLRRSGSRLLVCHKDRHSDKDTVLLEVPAAKLQGVLLYGNVQATTQCLRALLNEGIWLSIFSRQGTYRGRLQPPAERGGRLRLRQWERSRQPEYCLEFARGVVHGKILAARHFAAAQAKNRLALCVNNSETSLPSTITVGAEKDSHLHEQDQW